MEGRVRTSKDDFVQPSNSLGEEEDSRACLVASPPPGDNVYGSSFMDRRQLMELSRYEVEKILAEDSRTSGFYYLVRWANYPLLESTWEPEENFDGPEILVRRQTLVMMLS